ncbi:molybdopterin-synthase adenylyltransferase MoeB [Psychrosphaera sp. F3M07]|uniref:Molybdopterin-synthase adenylyltransferase MoeB n=1 Tax=Psychrosphaera aquimarina TaxID=2044854 RepID=A0ABU3R198_9GAMM|nr:MULTISPECIES: molybdopterin-synthase adenylyltransferase MoeB [Psychrosphaera]MBU2917016.1 molybdopterin-synthase adenylyltransferase MoeB [Psychrosphaera sp. F3M07]MDU0113466.1 molybdopterin-synthase adenylyltransferase MoeB [Psychrosphaera aquimarina]
MAKIVKPLSDQQLLRYSRHIMLPNMDIDGQEKLWNSKVLIIGVGGLGCAVAQYLACSGIGKLTLVDDDKVDKTNLQRQVLHTENNVGLNKCDSAKQSLQQLNSEITIDTHTIRLTGEVLLQTIQEHDVVVDCSDNLTTRNELNLLCFKTKTPLVSGAAIRMEGQVATFTMDKDQPCYQCISSMFGEQELTCSESGILSPVVGVIGSLQATETIKLLVQIGEVLSSRLLMFDAVTMSFNEFKLNQNLTCSVCSK